MGMQTAAKRPTPGEYLRRTRMRLGLTTRDVAQLSHSVVVQQKNEVFSLSHARLVQVENEESVPSIFKLFTLSAIYGVSLTDILTAYLDLEAPSLLHMSMPHANTHISSVAAIHNDRNVPIPLRVNATASLANTNLVAQLFDLWGEIPASLLEDLCKHKSRYGFIGLTDQTMHPLIRPGSFVQIDECRKPVPNDGYRTEFDRPIYFIELRTGYICSWCEVSDGCLISIPHPLSPCRTRKFAFPLEAEIIGRVTAVVVRFVPAAVERGKREAGLAVTKSNQSSIEVSNGQVYL
jgi:transcriptional regulator with XRE-family HTH domain